LNIRQRFVRVESVRELGALREEYLDGLPFAQEALLEVLVQNGECYVIEARGERAGYFVVHRGDALVEYHVTPRYLAYSHLFFSKFVVEYRIASALIKSYDHTALACAMDLQVGVKSKGVLVREFVRRELPEVPRISYTRRVALAGDLPRISAVDQPVFTHPERLRGVVREGRMRLFEKGDSLVGFGIIRPIIAGRPDVDIGLAVDKPYRNRGYALYLLRDLIDECLSQGLNPVGGCARENEPSIRMGLRVGLVSRFRLLELTFRS
jgi:GNAT superfamily N-acetyltransferase